MNTNQKRLSVLTADDKDDTCMTFVLKDEDHTLGNALKFVIMQKFKDPVSPKETKIQLNYTLLLLPLNVPRNTSGPEVKFCAYSIQNPSENLINLRIQTHGSPPADAFRKGLEDIAEICDHITHTYKEARRQYDEKQENMQMDR